MRRRSCFILLAVIVLLLVAGINGVKADQHLSDYQLRKDIESTLSAFVFDAQWAKTVPDTVIAIYHAAPGFGVAILKYDSSTGFSVLEKNDQMIPSKGSSATARLDDHTPEYSIEIGWEDPKENDYLTLQADDQENWKIINLEYTISDGQDDKMVFCRLSEDGKTAIISPLVDPRIEWPVDQEFSFSEFNLVAAQELCENALSILKDPERSKATDQGYRVVHVAMDQYNPEIPNRFDSRMDEEEKLLYLTREDQNGTIQTTWIFHWEEKAEAWLLVRAEQIEYTSTEYDEDSVVTEWITEITADAVHSTKWLRDIDTQQVLCTYWDVTCPNVLDQNSLLLKRFNFDTPPVNAVGYNWSRNYGAYADPTLLPKLYARFFSENQYVDGYLQEDRTLSFIVRKESGDLVLFCGADEGEAGWEWVESSPLPEGTRFGDSNITDAVNMNAWQGGAAVGVRRYGKGRWGLSYVNSYDFFVGPDWIGLYGSEMNSQFFGTHAWGDITVIDWTSLPPEEFGAQETKETLSAMVDRTGWAVTAQTDPDATTKLLVEAGREDSLLGNFYNGTPLFVLEQGSAWTKVRIGTDENTGAMTGWMRTEDLAFGDNMLQVNRDAIQIHSEKVLIHPVVPFIGSESGIMTATQFSECLVIGEAESDQKYAIVYSLKDGNVGFVPITSLGNGNG
ncbi:MAG: hypothetical protein IKQ45_07800 [Clostridia bacterium]|nr:hypothetical protein [Clostridia bacterium]